MRAIPLFLLILAAGCHCTPPAGKYFDRGSPFNTISGFAYAIDAGQWGFAYDCLTASSRKLYSYTKFMIALRFNLEVPHLEVPIRDLILTADRQRYNLLTRGPRAALEVEYEHPNGTLIIQNIYLERESQSECIAAGRDEPVWLIDLERTFLNMQDLDISDFE